MHPWCFRCHRQKHEIATSTKQCVYLSVSHGSAVARASIIPKDQVSAAPRCGENSAALPISEEQRASGLTTQRENFAVSTGQQRIISELGIRH